MQSNALNALPRAARNAMSKLGQDIALARRKRRISTVSMAERAFISRNTLYKLERGDPAVSMGVYATVLDLLGLSDRLAEVADRQQDIIGLDMDELSLPKRIVRRRNSE